jgi:U4/U6 small nuclear ribonucleoprotein PRP31
MLSEGWDGPAWESVGGRNTQRQHEDEGEATAIDFDLDMLAYPSVKHITGLLRSHTMADAVRRIGDYTAQDVKNAIPKDDPEYGFVCECSELVLHVEVEKAKVFKFLRDHYAVRFPELALFVTDGVKYAQAIEIIQNAPEHIDGNGIEKLEQIFPSQLIAVIVACGSTTQGRALADDSATAVLEACKEMEALEAAKQMLLEYIQQRIPLICPNLCAFLGSGITSQMFALTSSVDKIATMDPTDLANLGSVRHDKSGIPIKTAGFLANSDLVANHPPQLRPKALRLVANAAVVLARVDAHRRASDDSEGLRQRQDVRNKMIQWTDPLVIRGAANSTYERKGRKRLKDPIEDQERRRKQQQQTYRARQRY